MVKKRRLLEPRQQRSRESLNRLLLAAAEVLGQHGLRKATIPRIAKHAGLTPGAVYRRFKNKEVLIETMILRLLEDQDVTLRQSISIETATEIPFDVLAGQLINGLVLSYRSKAGLLRAVRQFAQDREGTAFARKITNLEVHTMRYLVDLLMQARGNPGKPDARGDIGFALAVTIGALWELIVNLPDRELWRGLIPATDQDLRRHLTRMFLKCCLAERA